ncbi:MAG: hypothetical protein NVS2B3_14370 [Vulcanimicrobiaceae bacterium]
MTERDSRRSCVRTFAIGLPERLPGTWYGMAMPHRLSSLRSELVLFVTNRILTHVPSHRVRGAFLRRVMNFQIDPSAAVLMGTHFDRRHGFTLGAGSIIGAKCRIDTRGGVVIGAHANLAAEVVVLSADHDVQSRQFDGRERSVSIGDRAFIGTRAMILPGVTIGPGAVVGAGSIVTRDVAPYSIVAGNPARQIGIRSRDLAYTLDYRRLLH